MHESKSMKKGMKSLYQEDDASNNQTKNRVLTAALELEAVDISAVAQSSLKEE
jgi:hypothetical protein